MQNDLLAIKAKYNGEEVDNDAEVDDDEEE
jgi:hypothetical protein